MGFQNLGNAIETSFVNVFQGAIEFLPELLLAILLFILGLVVGAFVGRGIQQLLERAGLNGLVRNESVERASKRAGYEFNLARLIGFLLKWFIIIVFSVAALQVLGLAEIQDFLGQVVSYLPRVLGAVIILLIGAVLGEFLQNVISASARSANVRSASALGMIARWSIWVFAALAALSQLGIAAYFVQTFFTGIIIAAALAFGLAFGLGGRDAAGKYLEKMQSEMSGRDSRRDL
jgi:small-conductance mechanosensitive channel